MMIELGIRSQIARVLLVGLMLAGTVAWAQGSIGTIVFARGEANVEPVDPADSFPAGIGIIYAFFEFKNLAPSDIVSGTWYRGEEVVISQATTLSQLLGAAGVVPTGKLYFSMAFDDGAVPGLYRLDISLNSELVQSRKFTVEEGVAQQPAEDGVVAGSGNSNQESATQAESQQDGAAQQSVAQQQSQSQGVAQQPSSSQGSFDPPGIAAQFVEGETVSMLNHYTETLSDPQLVFAFSEMQPGPGWGWRVSREGQSVAEQMDLEWEGQGTGLHHQPLGMELTEGVYDIDLFLDGAWVGSNSITVGSPVPDEERLLFSDEFDDLISGWGTVEGDGGQVAYEEGRLVMRLTGSNLPAVSVHSGIHGDAVIEVDASTLGGPADNALGIVARYQDAGNYYAFLVSADGYYSILHFQDGTPVWDQQWQFDGVGGINMGVASNHLRVLSDGAVLRFYVNGRFKGMVRDAIWRDGQMGVFGGVFDEPGVEVGFDSWRLWSLQ